MSVMNSVFLSLIAIISVQLTSSIPINDTQCIENPTGGVSLNVAVHGVPGSEGLQGPKGDIGPEGKMGFKGDRGVQGEKGEHGRIGPDGPKGMKGEVGIRGQKGARGIQGSPGREGRDGLRGFRGRDGLPGPKGTQGEPGDTVINKEEFNRISNSIHNSVLVNINSTVNTLCKKVEELNNSVLQEVKSGDEGILDAVMTELKVMNETLNQLKYHLPVAKCGIFGNWRKIAYFDTTQGDSCPNGLHTVINTTTNQTACGRTNTGAGCTSLTFPSSGNYSNVCGRVRGYQYGHCDTFTHSRRNYINDAYVDGISITQGQPRKHLWTYAVGFSEQSRNQCPCNGNGPGAFVPTFVGDHYYCESGFIVNLEQRVAWEDPLWDGNGCRTTNNTCCDRFGFFYRDVTTSADDIEVRWCSNTAITEEDSPVDQLEIWVM